MTARSCLLASSLQCWRAKRGSFYDAAAWRREEGQARNAKAKHEANRNHKCCARGRRQWRFGCQTRPHNGSNHHHQLVDEPTVVADCYCHCPETNKLKSASQNVYYALHAVLHLIKDRTFQPDRVGDIPGLDARQMPHHLSRNAFGLSLMQ